MFLVFVIDKLLLLFLLLIKTRLTFQFMIVWGAVWVGGCRGRDVCVCVYMQAIFVVILYKTIQAVQTIV